MSVAVAEQPTVERPKRAPRPTFAVNVNVGVLREAVTFAKVAVPGRPAVPILGCLLLTVGPRGFTIAGFDYELFAEQHVSSQPFGRARGRVAVNGREFASIVGALGKATAVRLEADTERLTITADVATFTLPLFTAADYPSPPPLPKRVAATLTAEHVKRLTGVTVAAGHDGALPVLTGVHVTSENAKMVAACTNRYQLAISEVGVKFRKAFAPQLIPARTVALLDKWFSGGVRFYAPDSPAALGEGRVGFVHEGRTLVARTLDGEFPKVRSVVPDVAGVTTVLTGEQAKIAAAVKLVSVVTTRTAPVRVVAEGATVKLTTGQFDDVRASVPIVGATLTGADTMVALNPTYLADGMTPFEKDAKVQVHVWHPNKPLVFTSESRPEFLFLLMPVRLAD